MYAAATKVKELDYSTWLKQQTSSGGTYLWIAGMVYTESLSSPADHCIQTNTLGSRGAFFEGIGFQWEWPAKKWFIVSIMAKALVPITFICTSWRHKLTGIRLI